MFLDRDGVLNEVVERDGQPASPRKAAEFRLVGDVHDAVRRLRAAGLPVYVVTNQPDLARGLLPQRELDAMVKTLRDDVGVDDVRVCPHDDGDGCACRKPLPGLLQDLAAVHDVRLDGSYMVGDTWRDMEAGRTAGCRTVLLRTWYNDDASGDAVVDTLSQAADWILAAERSDADGADRGEGEGAAR